MPKIHGPDGVLYSQPEKKQDGTQWMAFSDAKQIAVVQRALEILRTNVAKIPSCDQFFQALPRHRTFNDVLEDPKIWISYDPTGPAAAETVGNYITLGKKTLDSGHWQVAATLVHELAHVGGAEDINAQAETALQHCGLKEHFLKANTTAPATPRKP